jgi:Helicase C-terminal domain
VSGSGVEIVPEVLPVRLVRAYTNAAHRLYMSATLADDAVLVRELGCSAEAALSPIVAGSEVGFGERMVLAPSLLDKALDRSWLMDWCRGVAKSFSVVVLCPSERQAREWEAYGAKAVLGDDVPQALTALKSGKLRFAAFAQRYDGIDLPDDACRVLVLDGMPYGQGIADRFDSGRPALPGGIRNRLIYRIEQGMGRAVRSHADYAVVILAGPELASFTAKIEVRELMGAETKTQIDLAPELADLAVSDEATDLPRAFDDMAKKCLNRDSGWKVFYDERVRKTVRLGQRDTAESAVKLAEAERHAFELAVDGDFKTAGDLLQKGIDEHCGKNEHARPNCIQNLARIKHVIDPGEALQLQKSAYQKSMAVLRPPPGTLSHPADPGKASAASRFLAWYKQFSNASE